MNTVKVLLLKMKCLKKKMIKRSKMKQSGVFGIIAKDKVILNKDLVQHFADRFFSLDGGGD